MAALHSHPLYVHPHSKHALMTAVNVDTHFLAELNVIDYSLLVGVDATTNELVVGLVGTREYATQPYGDAAVTNALYNPAYVDWYVHWK